MLTKCYPVSTWTRTAGARSFEPVTLDEARKQCELAPGDAYHDIQLQSLIETAREQVEKDSSVILCSGTYTQKRTEFPYKDWFELYSLFPINSITSITSVATDGDTDIWSSTEYSLDTNAYIPIVKLGYDYNWPTIRGDINGITITVSAGFTTIALLKEQARRAQQAVLMLIEHWFSHRGIIGAVGKEIEWSYSTLIEGLRKEVYG